MALTRIAVAGALGRMGRALVKVVDQDPACQLAGAWERPHGQQGQDAGQVVLGKALGVRLEENAAAALRGGKAGVVIDFTAPEATMETLRLALESRTPLVIGTTGFDAKQKKAIEAAAKKIPIVLSSNYSVGMNLLWKALAMVAAKTGDGYDVEVIEAHHNAKKDSPSGTAMTTAEVLAKALGRDLDKVAAYGRPKGNIGARKAKEIGMHTVRGGDIVGDHTVLFAGPGERLEFKHQAHSRDNFAIGAVRAAKWVAQAKKKAGLYSMADVLAL
jgi:4-hydroxy-tetrahydrodipicolinate reductase